MTILPGWVSLKSRQLGKRMLAAAVFSVVGFALPADAQELTATQHLQPANTVDAELILALPASLGTGLSSGVGAGYLRRIGDSGRFALGARASWSTATEYSLTESVRDDEIRMRLCALAQHVAGRGSFGLRLGVGATAMYEGRTRAQGSRLGLSGSDLETTNWYLFPGADLDVVVFLRIWNAWGMTLSGGSTLHLVDGSARVGWSSAVGIAWQP
jgi:hypothetical protein